jgi:hypothetical protein
MHPEPLEGLAFIKMVHRGGLKMTNLRTIMLSVAVAALSLGVAGGITLAAEDSESAKMGKEEGTHVGPAQGVTPGTETSKIVQPPRKSPTTGGETPTQPTTGDQTGQ